MVMKILSKQDLENAIIEYGVLPFFRNEVRGLSIEEMTPPGLIFGGNDFDGCWEWKGPVVRERTTAYGKFFNKKAGFISLELLPHFLNWRRAGFKPAAGSKEEMILDIISINDRMNSTNLRESILGLPFSRKRTAYDLPDLDPMIYPNVKIGAKKPSRHTLESPLQKLQMGGWICISDFQYKTTKKGERYGWGVAEYSTPENIFESKDLFVAISPNHSLEFMTEFVGSRFKKANQSQIRSLLIT